jgi:hypothetical protein
MADGYHSDFLPELVDLRVQKISGNDDDVMVYIHMEQDGSKRPSHSHLMKVRKSALRRLMRYMAEELGPSPYLAEVQAARAAEAAEVTAPSP